MEPTRNAKRAVSVSACIAYVASLIAAINSIPNNSPTEAEQPKAPLKRAKLHPAPGRYPNQPKQCCVKQKLRH